MLLHRSAKIEQLMPMKKLNKIIKQLNKLGASTNRLLKMAEKLSPAVGELLRLMRDDNKTFKIEIERELGFYNSLLKAELVDYILEKDMPRLVLPFIKEKFTKREFDFVCEIFFNIIIYARVCEKRKPSFRQKWRYCEIIEGAIFYSDNVDECETIYNELKRKGIIIEANDQSGFYLNIADIQWEGK